MTHALNAPRVFSLLEALEDTLAFLDELRRLVATPDLRVRIDLKDVATISPEVVAAFVAVMSSTPHEHPVKHGPAAYNVFTEAMANTFEHASKSARGVDRLWAAVCYDARRKATCFTAVDTGVGILRSFNLQQHAEAWREGPGLAVPDQGKILRML